MQTLDVMCPFLETCFHFDNFSDPQRNRLKTMLSDFGLSKLLNVHTHRGDHIFGLGVVCSEDSLAFLGESYAGLSDHIVVCRLAVTKPPSPTRLFS